MIFSQGAMIAFEVRTTGFLKSSVSPVGLGSVSNNKIVLNEKDVLVDRFESAGVASADAEKLVDLYYELFNGKKIDDRGVY